MKLTTKINIYIIFVCLVIIVAVKYQTDKYKELVDLYVFKMIEQKEELFNTVIKVRGEPYKKILEENTLWNDLIKYVNINDSKWARYNLKTMLDLHQANCVWIYNKKNEKIYSTQNLSDSLLKVLPFSKEYVDNLFGKTKFPHFFLQIKEGLLEIYGASIHPTYDLERKSVPAGYYFVGKLWDKEYESKIEQLIDCSINIVFPGDKDTLYQNISARTFSKELKDPINGKEIATIKVSKDITQLKDIEQLSKNTSIGIMIFFVVFIVITGFMVWYWVIVPLYKISHSLNFIDSLYISKIINDKSVFGNIARMISEFFSQKKEIEENARKFRDMFEYHSAVMILIDPKSGKIVDANKSCETYYGYTVDKLKTMDIAEINVSAGLDIKSELTKFTLEKENYSIYKHKLADGSIRDVEVYSKPVNFGDKIVLFAIIHDITKRKKAETLLVEAKNEAEKATLTKAQFLSNMSHEIRTPLNTIIGLANLMINENDIDIKRLENLKAIKFSADHLHAIINDILDFSKIEAGKTSLEKIEFNFRELIENTAKTFELKTKEKGLYLKTTLEEKIPKILIGDPVRLNQIMINLLGNAVKFTETGGIEVKVDINEINNHNIDMNIKVIDTGIGISASRINNIFESFTQAYVDTTRKFGGTGLGLAITKKLVELQGGKVIVESQVGKGSTFSFNLTFGISERQDFKKEVSNISHKDLAGVKLLLAEDNVMNQFFAKQLFAKWKINVNVANNGVEAVELLKKNDYDILLLDLQMPEMNGFQVIEIIRDSNSDVKNHNIPVIALTADISQETKDKVKSCGVNDFVLKPFEQNELYGKISKFVSWS
jgi:PAS domain S-box-containing protein